VAIFACIFAAKKAITFTSTVSIIAGLHLKHAALLHLYRQVRHQDVANQAVKLNAIIAATVVVIGQLNSLMATITTTPQNAYELGNVQIVVANALTLVQTAAIEPA
jgi:multisubunit Na+/H+ antiporter MnhF subunit